MPDCVLESPIRVYLLIENRLLREALGRLFRKRADFHIVGQCGQSEIKRPDFQAAGCDVLAIDFFDQKLLSALLPVRSDSMKEPHILLIGMDDNSDRFLEAVRAGVSGYLLKDASACDVVAAIRATMKGEAICPPRLCATLFRWFAETTAQPQERSSGSRRAITLRQRQLAQLMAKGLTNKEIAAQLNLSEFTVRNHIHRILKQTHAGTRREAVEVIFARNYA